MPNTKTLHVLGVSFRTAPAAVREALSFDSAGIVSLLRVAAADAPTLEALVLSTCNRTEFWLATPAGYDVNERWLSLLKRLRPEAPILRSDCARYHLKQEAAVRHICRVACGLDSAVLGDAQIRRQVKDAAAVAVRAGTAGRHLHRVLALAFTAGRRAHEETALGRGSASIGSAVAGLIAERTGAPGDAPVRVLVIGAGEIARNVGWHVTKRRLGTLTFINRTQDRAVEAAAHCGGVGRPWGELSAALAEADVAVAATSASAPVLDRKLLDAVASARSGRPLLLVDVGMPRNVARGSAVEVIDIDAIRDRFTEHLAAREAAVPDAERIVESQVGEWVRWWDGLAVEAIIKQLYLDAEQLSGKLASRLAPAQESLTPDAVRAEVLRGCKHLLHGHVRRLRGLAVG